MNFDFSLTLLVDSLYRLRYNSPIKYNFVGVFEGTEYMAINERIRFFRKKRGMTQKYLGQMLGFKPRPGEIRMTQYETSRRTPKPELVETIAEVLSVSPMALDIPNIESELGLIHTLFALEDIYGLKIDRLEGIPCLRLNLFHNPSPTQLFKVFNAWYEQSRRLAAGEITPEEYDQWRYHFPKYADSENLHTAK